MAKVAEESGRYEAEQLRTPAEIGKRIQQLEERMYKLARDLEFESAAAVRDEIHKLRERLVELG
ncbi:UvrB/uvrC motif protein [compost metagenome]